MNVKVYRVSEPDRGGRGYAWGTDEATGEDVFFAGDWRPMMALREAVGHRPEQTEMFPPSIIAVDIEEWQVIGRGPGFAYAALETCGCGHPKHWRECRAVGCYCRRRGPSPNRD